MFWLTFLKTFCITQLLLNEKKDMEKDEQIPKKEELKIVSRPSNEEIEEDLIDKPNRKWKKFPSATIDQEDHPLIKGEKVSD